MDKDLWFFRFRCPVWSPKKRVRFHIRADGKIFYEHGWRSIGSVMRRKNANRLRDSGKKKKRKYTPWAKRSEKYKETRRKKEIERKQGTGREKYREQWNAWREKNKERCNANEIERRNKRNPARMLTNLHLKVQSGEITQDEADLILRDTLQKLVELKKKNKSVRPRTKPKKKSWIEL